MSYTPVELRHVRVGRSLFGYNRAMVEQIIEEVAQSFEATWRERGELLERVEAQDKQLAELREREELLTNTLVAAEQAAVEVRARAKHEAEAILAEAQSEAREIGRSARAEQERLLAETRKIEAMLRGALGVIGQATEPPASAFTVEIAEIEAIQSVLASDGALVAEAASPPESPESPESPDVPWAPEDTRELGPIATVEPETPDGAEEAIEPLQRLRLDKPSAAEATPGTRPGRGSRDFDWGE